jgi:hypothetical protein
LSLTGTKELDIRDSTNDTLPYRISQRIFMGERQDLKTQLIPVLPWGTNLAVHIHTGDGLTSIRGRNLELALSNRVAMPVDDRNCILKAIEDSARTANGNVIYIEAAHEAIH